MKSILIVLAIIAFSLTAKAQTNDKTKQQIEDERFQRMLDSLRKLPVEQKIFTAVEKEPQFPGGMEKLYQYLKQNLNYPDKARKDNVRGNVFVSFIVERDGSLSDIKISRSLSSEIDAEAIRIMSNCPKWVPGMQNGRTVRVAYTIPIRFPFPD